MAVPLPQLKVSAIRDGVADAIRSALLHGRFQPGAGLSEVALAAELNVSRGPVREALLVLAQEGLLVHHQNRGFSVLEFSERDLAAIETVRVPLEAIALKLARDRITAEGVERLESLRDNLVALFEAEQQGEVVQAELDFHSAIWQESGNPWLVGSLRRIMVPCFTYGTAFKMRPPELTAAAMEHIHSLYIDYIKGKDRHQAEECVRIHMGSAV